MPEPEEQLEGREPQKIYLAGGESYEQYRPPKRGPLRDLLPRCITCYVDSGWYFIVMEYCDMGNLLNYQSKANKKTLSFSEASKILLQLLNGI